MKKIVLVLLVLSTGDLLAQHNPIKRYQEFKSNFQFLDRLEKIKTNGQKTSQFNQAYTYFEYDKVNQQWDTLERYTEWIQTFTNQASKIKLGIKMDRYQNGLWINSDSMVFVADTALNRFKIPEEIGLVDTFKLYLWNDSLMSWELQLLEHLTFSSNQLQEYNGFVLSSYLGLSGNTFINLSQTRYTYNTNGQLEYYLKYRYAFGLARLYKRDSIRVLVDQNGFPFELTTYNVDIIPSGPFNKELLVYDRYGNTVDKNILSYNNSTSSFDSTYRYRYIYDQNRNLLSDTSYSYRNNTEEKDYYGFSNYLQNDIQDHKAYYYYGGIPSLKYESEYFYSSPTQLDSLISYNYLSGSRELSSKEIYQNTSFITNLNEEKSLNYIPIVFFPNPTSEFIYFKQELKQRVSIFDVSGRLVDILPLKISKYNLGHLENGIYFIKSENQTYKLIKY